MTKFRLPRSNDRKTDRIIGGLLLIVVALIFWFSPNRQIVDSKYSMLLSESLMQHRSFMLDVYRVPQLTPTPQRGWIANGDIYQMEWIGDHLYYFFPPGTSVLSAPYVALMNAFGISAVSADGTPDIQGETIIQGSLSALLMALLASVFFFTARLMLPRGWSVLAALAFTLGTQIWSTASRGLWTDTWGLLLLGFVVRMLLAQETKGRRINPALLASLLAWAYFVRPTNAIPIAAITVYLFVYYRRYYRRLIVPYVVTGAAWGACFVAYSWYHFGRLLPGYYMANRLSVEVFWTALSGNLISPSRGLLVYVPVLFFVAYLLVRYRRELASRKLILLSAAIIAGHLAAISSFLPWHGGWCYGPRYSTGLVPWFMLLAIFGIDAMRRWRAANEANLSLLNWHAPLGAGALLVLLSVFIHARGAASIETARWNVIPVNVDFQPDRVWEWRYPQFMAGLILPPLPAEFPVVQSRIDFASPEFEKFKWYGWSTSEGQFRWTETNEAGMAFTLDKTDYSSLQIKLGTFLVPGKLDAQRVNVVLNGRELAALTLSDGEARVYSVKLPEGALRHKNILVLQMPDAVAPEVLGVNSDGRFLCARAEWMEFQP